MQIRGHLAELSTGPDSPFAIAPGTHLARLVVLDDVIYVGMPAREEHLKSKYLVFESNCDGDRDSYLTGLAQKIPDELDSIWKHCTGYPRRRKDRSGFSRYMKKCEIETTFFFAPVNNKTRDETLRALANAARCRALHRHASSCMPPTQIHQDIQSPCVTGSHRACTEARCHARPAGDHNRGPQ